MRRDSAQVLSRRDAVHRPSISPKLLHQRDIIQRDINILVADAVCKKAGMKTQAMRHICEAAEVALVAKTFRSLIEKNALSPVPLTERAAIVLGLDENELKAFLTSIWNISSDALALTEEFFQWKLEQDEHHDLIQDIIAASEPNFKNIEEILGLAMQSGFGYDLRLKTDPHPPSFE